MGIIYCYTNKITGKKYIGQTIHPEQRKRNHLHEATKRDSDYYFHRSIRKHGWENFEYEVLEETDNLSEQETYYIQTMNTRWPNGYNQLESHLGMPDDVRQKISETKKKQWHQLSEEKKQEKLSILKNVNKGKKHSEETRKKMSESAKKHLAENPRTISLETRIKTSKTMKKIRAERNWSTAKKN